VNTEEVATPLESVVSVSVAVPVFAKVPLAPEGGAEKVTVTPLTGEPTWSTTADKGCVNVVPTVALCSDPFCALILIVGAGLFVKLKFAETDAREAVADTV